MIFGGFMLLLIFTAIEAGQSHLAEDGGQSNDDYSSIWQSFKNEYSKFYDTIEEEQTRFQIFVSNYQKIEDHNKEFAANRKSYQMGMNKFGDMSLEEFLSKTKRFDLSSSNRPGTTFLAPQNIVLPTAIDWRQKGYVTPVKEQGQCGSCGAFSITGTVEGQHFRKSGQLVSLSEQNLVDCVDPHGPGGCDAGWMADAYKYIKENGGIDTEDCYPNEDCGGPCRFKKECIGAQITGYVTIESGKENDLEAAVATVGPISVIIDASHGGFQFYKLGVYYEPKCSPTQLDHGVLVVGYGEDGGQKYYIVKNSWGAGWGDSGYIHMARERDNNCGIANMASYPLV